MQFLTHATGIATTAGNSVGGTLGSTVMPAADTTVFVPALGQLPPNLRPLEANAVDVWYGTCLCTRHLFTHTAGRDIDARD